MATRDTPVHNNTPMLVVAWLFVGIPLLWGVLDTLRNAIKLFQ